MSFAFSIFYFSRFSAIPRLHFVVGENNVNYSAHNQKRGGDDKDNFPAFGSLILVGEIGDDNWRNKSRKGAKDVDDSKQNSSISARKLGKFKIGINSKINQTSVKCR